MRKASLQCRISFAAAILLLLPVVATANTVDTVTPIEQGITFVSDTASPLSFPDRLHPAELKPAWAPVRINSVSGYNVGLNFLAEIGYDQPVAPGLDILADTEIDSAQISPDDFALSEDHPTDATSSLTDTPGVVPRTVGNADAHEPINLLLLMTGLFGLLGIVSKPA